MLSLCCCESGCCHSCSCPPPPPLPPLCVSAKPFVTAVKGPSSERQSPAEHGLHVLRSDRLCHSHPQQAGPARHPAPGLPQTRGKPPHTWQPATKALRTDCTVHSIIKKKAFPNVEHLILLWCEQLLTWMAFDLYSLSLSVCV